MTVSRPQHGGAIRLMAVGDICLARGVRQSIEKFGHGFVFEKVSPLLGQADILFGNLECVVGRPEPALEHPRVDMHAPASCAAALSAAGFTVLNIANNHSMDYGPAGLLETLDRLKAEKIFPVGAGRDDQEAHTAVLIEKNGITAGIMGYADNSTGHPSGKNPAAKKRRPGIAAYCEKRILEDVAKLKKKADVVVISLHADLEFSAYPSPARVRFSRKLIDSGAGIVLQHHPHVPQGLERYKEGLIVYSLGNFVFPVAGNEYLLANSAYCDKSFILDVLLTKRKVAGVQIVPVRITDQHRPEPLAGDEARRLIAYVAELSESFQDPCLLAEHGYKTSVQMFRKTLNQMKTSLLQRKFAGFARTAAALVRRSEHRRWIKELLMSAATARVLRQRFRRDSDPRKDNRAV